MGIDKQASKGGNYVGSFLQMFDWNAKSRKKLFSSRSDMPDQAEQKKMRDGKFPTMQRQMLDDDENADRLSVKGSGDYSRASSVTDGDFFGVKRASIVARLMGLDSLPNSNMSEFYSTPLSDSQSLQGTCHWTKSNPCYQDQVMHSSSLQDVALEVKYQKIMHRPMEKFQTEALPPKSAKSIPITHHKLLSPIKSANFTHPKDADHIMEEAAKIIKPGRPQLGAKVKLPTVGSSSVPLKVRDFKEKIQAAPKQFKLFDGSQTKAESSTAKNQRRHSISKSCNGRVDATSVKSTQDSEASSIGVKSRGKSISLALQAKANVQKREGITIYSGKNQVNQKQQCEVSPNAVSKTQSTNQKSMLKKQSTENASNVLRLNNQKQNCINDRGKKPPSKCSPKDVKTINGESASARHWTSSNLSCTSKVCSRRLNLAINDRREILSSSSERVVTRNKRSIDGNYQSEKSKSLHSLRMDRNEKSIQSSAVINRQGNSDQDTDDRDIISFTFTAPLTQSRPGSRRPAEAGEENRDECAPKFSILECNIKGDALSTLLEQKIKELAHKVELSQHISDAAFYDTDPGSKIIMSSTMQAGNIVKDKIHKDIQGVLEDIDQSDSSASQSSKLLDCRLSSPVSILKNFTSSDNCNSSGTTDSYSTGGSKQCSLIQSQQVFDSSSCKTFYSVEGDAELSDSASSSSIGTVEKRRETIKPGNWELEYVKEMLCSLELVFNEYTSGRSSEIISPDLFDQVRNQKDFYNKDGVAIPEISQRILFDCVSECLGIRCRLYTTGGCKLWAKGVSMLRRKDQLAEAVYREITGWNNISDSMIDELVDRDMSSWHGRWLNYETESFELGKQVESRILNSLIDEVIGDV